MRIVAWNIRAGGGVRADKITQQLQEWQPDIVVLSEFRGTEASQAIADSLRSFGLTHQKMTVDSSQPAKNALLVASHWPLRTVRLKRAPDNTLCRWLHVNVASPRPMAVIAVHIPNRISGVKYPFMDAITDVIRHWRGPPAMLLGDTNSGRIDIDEESKAFSTFEDRWMQTMEALNWRDAFRYLHDDKREFTWYSPNGRNGFRLDQAFLHRHFLSRLKNVRHDWGNGDRRDALSDHAAIVMDLGW
jgi:exodeoxyribonuclease-3